MSMALLRRLLPVLCLLLVCAPPGRLQAAPLEWGCSSLSSGTVLSLREALDWTITRSDNGAALALVHRLGGQNALNATFSWLDMPRTSFGDEAQTTAADQ